MRAPAELIRVDPASIHKGRPLAHSIFTMEGALLAAQGARIIDSRKVEILRWQGWRLGEPIPSEPSVTESEVQRPTPQMPSLQLAPPPPLPLGQAVALVADDMPLARSLLTRILTEQGVKRVVAVEDGKQAITRFFIDTPNLAFLDIDMPNLDGLEALKQIKSWSPESFVCLVSANSTQVNVQVALEHKVDAFLVKPYTILNMRRVLGRYRARIKDAF